MEPANSSLPHNRSSAFFDDDGTFSSRFRDSINRWSTALLNDEPIERRTSINPKIPQDVEQEDQFMYNLNIMNENFNSMIEPRDSMVSNFYRNESIVPQVG